ncbi:MAG: Asp23/Gls24 family envelope stress response protein [Firmicutes bacterium]|nr:Asp23/Gls24 family envelope stress response protein [Bacillota bacterium]
MSVNTANAYGRITVTDEAIAQIAGQAALECYGIVDLVSKKLSDSLADLMKKKRASRGVKVITSGGRIIIDLYVIIKYGVSIDAVAQSLRRSVKYATEKFTGMVVDAVNVNVAGVRV